VTPTTRCAALVGAIALGALLVPLWVVVGAWSLLLAVTAFDGLAVRDAPRVERRLGAVLARGVPARFSALATPRDARRVLLRQPATDSLLVHALAGERSLDGDVVALRRGRHELPGLAAASVGPLGLARWYHRRGAPAELLVYPDLPTARRLALQLRQGRAAPAGRLRRGPLGVGTDFESIRDYSPDDDIRHVNWRASARMGRPMSNQYRVEQDRDVVFLLDAGRLMTAPVATAPVTDGHARGGSAEAEPAGGASDGSAPDAARATLLDAALDAATAVALVADELGDHCGAIAFDAEIRRAIDPRRLGGRRVLRALFDLQPSALDSDFERAVLRVGGSRRAFVLVFTDLVDEQAARSLLQAAPMLARRHAVLVASVADPALDALAQDAPGGDAARSLAAESVLEARERTALLIRRAGAGVLIAPSRSMSQRCVLAYLRAKARARL
jgi:uncharacterized protein (DUF58 family)